jgi:hypothetical protein
VNVQLKQKKPCSKTRIGQRHSSGAVNSVTYWLSIFARKPLLKKTITLEDANRIMEEAMTLMQGNEYEIASLQVLSLVAMSTCSAYDCEFVALAQDLNVPMITVDKQILAQFPNCAISLDEYARQTNSGG